VFYYFNIAKLYPGHLTMPWLVKSLAYNRGTVIDE